jgi:GntR family transcriptional regulator
MTSKVERVPPPFAQIAERFRTQIREGVLEQGAQLPSIVAIAREAGVATATASKAIQQLQREGYVLTSNQGTFVDLRKNLTQGSDRLQMLRVSGSGLRSGERVDIVGAGLTRAPNEVAFALDVPSGGDAAWRRRVYLDDEGVMTVSTSWLPKNLAESLPELLDPSPLPKMTFGLVEERTGRRVVRRSDTVAIRSVPADVAPHLGVEPGQPALTMVNRYWDQNGDPVEFALDFYGAGRELSAEHNL